MKRITAIAIALALAGLCAKAQIWIEQDNSVHIGSLVSEGRAGVNMTGPGVYMGLNHSFLDLNLDPSVGSPCLSGNNNALDFYNNLEIARFYQRSDSTAKCGIEPILTASPAIALLQTREVKGSRNNGLMVTAESLVKALPESVTTDLRGRKCADINELVPMLAKAIAELDGELAKAEAALETREGTAATASGGHALSYRYSIPAGAASAQLQICDKAGRQLKVVNVMDTESLELTPSDFGGSLSGWCSLVVDGVSLTLDKIEL